jgi:hypothetical protein
MFHAGWTRLFDNAHKANSFDRRLSSTWPYVQNGKCNRPSTFMNGALALCTLNGGFREVAKAVPGRTRPDANRWPLYALCAR